MGVFIVASLWGWIATNIVSIITPIVAAIGTILVARIPKKGSNENSVIDQLQENVESLTKRVDNLDNTIETQRKTIQVLFSKNLSLKKYIHALEIHIESGNPPPPPSAPNWLQKEDY